jgi:formyltetrahydrofolate deformylase
MAGATSTVEDQTPPYSARLLIDCADRPGIVAAVSGFLYELGANIVSSHQYSSDPIGGRFYLRTEFFLEGLASEGKGTGEDSETDGMDSAGGPGGAGEADGLGGPGGAGGGHGKGDGSGAAGLDARTSRDAFERDFARQVAEPFEMAWTLRYWGERQRLAILVSRYDHCLMDLLWRHGRGELDAEVVCVISNHPNLEGQARSAGIAYYHVPVPPGGKPQAEQRMLELLRGEVDLVVLARYMQVLSGDFLDRLGVPVINIHHSFLPAFAGADPYRRAREHGVKLIGATAHYVTAELDAGPIIDQDVARVDHRDSVRDLERIGRDIERIVLSRAVALHLDDRVIADAGRTIVF